MHPFFIVVAAILFLLGFWGFLKAERRRRRFEDTPTSKAIGVFIGDVEVAGTAETASPLRAPLSGKEVVWYDWKVEEEWRRVEKVKVSEERAKVIHQEYEDQETSGWTTVGGGTSVLPFYLQDDSGVVRIDPVKARVEPISTYCRSCTASDSLYYAKGPRSPISDSTGNRRFSETAIPVHQEIFVNGRARVRDDAVAAELAWDDRFRDYLISTKLEKDHVSGQKAQSIGCRLFCITLSAIFFGALFSDKQKADWGAMAGLCLVLIGWVWIVHLSMVSLKNRSKQARSNMDVELKRRHSLIGSLLETVKGFRDYEAQTQAELAVLRGQFGISSVDDVRKGGGITPVANKVLAVMEKYPDLKSSELFLNLQRNLTQTEDRIALARQYYNDTVEYVNSRREAFPEGWVARISGVKKQEYFHAEEFERPPVVMEGFETPPVIGGAEALPPPLAEPDPPNS